MRFALTAEQEELRAVTRRFLTAKAGIGDLRRVIDTPTGHDPDVWAELAGLGLLALAVPEQHGGSGASLVETAVVLREAGRALLPAPLLATTTAAAALVLAEGEARHWLPGIAAGEIIATLAPGDESDAVVATPTPSRSRLGLGADGRSTVRAVRHRGRPARGWRPCRHASQQRPRRCRVVRGAYRRIRGRAHCAADARPHPQARVRLPERHTRHTGRDRPRSCAAGTGSGRRTAGR